MSKKMKLLSLLNNNNTEVKFSSSSSWPWLSCHQPRTLSFRANNNVTFKTINSTYLDATMDILESSESFFTVSTHSTSFSTNSDDSRLRQDSIETVIRESRSDRLFFEPDETNSILEAKSGIRVPFKDSVVVSMDSQDPYVDFRKSMEEIVEAHGVKYWEGIEKLFCWYLRVNEKSCHGYIVNAFVDLLFGLEFASSSCDSCFESEEKVDNITSSSLLLEQVKMIKLEEETSTSSSNV
ncbi:hypothetical protein Lal_00023486 [Lupinus albus]|uniref:Transcription repressor n=1 Tax=Lupinus albus TaxID=3870 RepID=A0A6A4NT12_LUPAL|nr:putative transcription factor OFP family [Lupinus albus]KAF1881450.1 hypothetical protein Lal_00023486 [Lupinus albus]